MATWTIKNLLTPIGILLSSVLWSANGEAHPFSQEEYSLRTAVTISDKGVVPLVVLEIPIPTALQEIGATVSDPKDVKRRKINAYNKSQWDTLSSHLTFTVDGTPMKGEWLAIDHPANGKATEGFFVYMVSFLPSKDVSLGDSVNIEIQNLAYPEAKMVYSGSATAKEPWVIEASTAKTVLGENELAELTDPKRWSTSDALRTMTVTATRTTTQ